MTTSARRRPRLVPALVVAGLALTLLAGCSSTAASSVGAQREAPAQPGEAPMPDGGAPQAPTLPGDLRIARSATVALVVDEVGAAAAELRRLAAVVGGTVSSESVSLLTTSETGDTSQVVLTVPAARLDQALTLIEGLGKVTRRTVESVDVTNQVVDVDSRVRTMRQSILRLQALMERAGSVSDIAAVEAELTQRQGDLEALLAQQKSLEEQVATSPITVALRAEGSQPQVEPGGFLAGLQSGWSALLAATQIGLTVIGVLLPWLLLATAIAAPFWLWRRRRSQVRHSTATAPLPTNDPAAPGPADPAGAGSA